jgi:hypothetical protein
MLCLDQIALGHVIIQASEEREDLFFRLSPDKVTELNVTQTLELLQPWEPEEVQGVECAIRILW